MSASVLLLSLTVATTTAAARAQAPDTKPTPLVTIKEETTPIADLVAKLFAQAQPSGATYTFASGTPPRGTLAVTFRDLPLDDALRLTLGAA